MASLVVSILFGGLMGWGLERRLPDIRVPVGALVTGMAVGAVFLLVGDDEEATLAGTSLLVGCAAAGIGLASRLLRGEPQLPQR